MSDDGLVAQVGVSLKPNGNGTEMMWMNQKSRPNSIPTIKLERASNLETENEHDYFVARESALPSLAPPSPATLTLTQGTARQSLISPLFPLTPTSLRQSTSFSPIRPSRPSRPESLSLSLPRESTVAGLKSAGWLMARDLFRVYNTRFQTSVKTSFLLLEFSS
jgi:hypothetical protein